MGPPPGGPPDKAPPRLLSTVPESLGVYPEFKGDVEFQFDETLSEGGTPSLGTGTSELERLVLVSPTPECAGRRLAPQPAQRPAQGRVAPQPGLPGRAASGVKDIRNNAEDSLVVVTFTTGAPLPTRRLRGRVVDWTTRQVGRGALVAAVLLPDSLPYLAYADSGGRYDLAPLPAGQYLMQAFVDQNRNRRLDSRELSDTIRMGEDSTEVPALWLQPHDTVPPRIQSIAVEDSTAATVEFTGPLDPYSSPPFASFRLLALPDSVVVEGASLVTRAEQDSLRARQRAEAERADTTTPKPAAPVPARPVPRLARRSRGRRQRLTPSALPPCWPSAQPCRTAW